MKMLENLKVDRASLVVLDRTTGTEQRLFRQLKGYRWIAIRHDKLDLVHGFFILLPLIVEALRQGEHALIRARA